MYVLLSPQLFGIIKGLRKTKCNKGLFSKMSFLIFGLDLRILNDRNKKPFLKTNFISEYIYCTLFVPQILYFCGGCFYFVHVLHFTFFLLPASIEYPASTEYLKNLFINKIVIL